MRSRPETPNWFSSRSDSISWSTVLKAALRPSDSKSVSACDWRLITCSRGSPGFCARVGIVAMFKSARLKYVGRQPRSLTRRRCFTEESSLQRIHLRYIKRPDFQCPALVLWCVAGTVWTKVQPYCFFFVRIIKLGNIFNFRAKKACCRFLWLRVFDFLGWCEVWQEAVAFHFHDVVTQLTSAASWCRKQPRHLFLKRVERRDSV